MKTKKKKPILISEIKEIKEHHTQVYRERLKEAAPFIHRVWASMFLLQICLPCWHSLER